MRRWLALAALLAGCNGNGLPGGTGGGGGNGGAGDLGQSVDLGCGGSCGDLAHAGGCGDLTDPVACDARADCYALFSGDLPCNNSSCQNHFLKCASAPPVCGPSTGACNGSCSMLTPSCRPGDTEVFPSASQTCCAIGCVTATKCPSPTSCTSDAQCGAGAYCRGALAACSSMCQLTIGTASTGACHRSCDNDACACADDADCPGPFSSCDPSTAKCKSLQPPICHADCPSGCTHSTDAQYGEICLCTSC